MIAQVSSNLMTRHLRLPTLLLAVLTSVPLVSIALPPKAMAQSNSPIYQQPERVLSVTGQGIVSIPTTLSQVSLGVTVQAPTAQAAQQQAAAQSTAVIEWLQTQPIEKLQTTGISLSPRYDYSGEQQALIGYEANNSISFRTATEQAGTIIDEAISRGATRINGVSFLAEESATGSARQQALELAIQDAQQQADTVLGALGFSQQAIINISIDSVAAPGPRAATAASRSRIAETATTPVIGQEQTINAQVTLSIRY